MQQGENSSRRLRISRHVLITPCGMEICAYESKMCVHTRRSEILYSSAYQYHPLFCKSTGAAVVDDQLWFKQTEDAVTCVYTCTAI